MQIHTYALETAHMATNGIAFHVHTFPNENATKVEEKKKKVKQMYMRSVKI